MAEKKRNIWCDDHVVEMLTLFKENHILKLLDSKTKRNKDVYENVAKLLGEKNIIKTGDQVKSKFKALKCDYYKIKRNNGTSGAQRQSSQYFDILDEILCARPVLNTQGVDTSEDNYNPPSLMEILDADSERNTLVSENEVTSTPNAAISQPIAQLITPNLTDTTNETPTVSTQRNFFKLSKKNTYEKVVQNFSNDWTTTQNNLLNKMKEEDDLYLGKVANVLEKNREETEKILENDRKETVNMFENLINNLKMSQIQQAPQYIWAQPNYGHIQTQSSASGVVVVEHPPT